MTTVLPTSFLPARVYFSSINKSDKVIIDVNESFPKQTIRNRSFILSANGLLKLSIPLSSRKNHSLTKDIQIDYSYSWQLQHIRALEAAYNSSAFFLFYQDELFSLINQKEKFLIDYNLQLTEWLLKKLKIETDIFFTDEYVHSYPKEEYKDYRNVLSYKQYQSPILPESNYETYFQTFSEKFDFFKNLSVIDLLFNEGNNASNLL